MGKHVIINKEKGYNIKDRRVLIKKMKLIEKAPKELYKIFGSKYMEFYMQFLVALYEESSQSFSLLGLTERECQMIMNERLAKMSLDWSETRVDEEGELITRANMASVSLKHFEDWGWLRRDYDETLNSYVVSFPEYSQLFQQMCWVELCLGEPTGTGLVAFPIGKKEKKVWLH